MSKYNHAKPPVADFNRTFHGQGGRDLEVANLNHVTGAWLKLTDPGESLSVVSHNMGGENLNYIQYRASNSGLPIIAIGVHDDGSAYVQIARDGKNPFTVSLEHLLDLVESDPSPDPQ